MFGEDQRSSCKYEELIGILPVHKWTFEDHLLNTVQKFNQKIHLGISRISRYMHQKKLRITRKAFVTI